MRIRILLADDHKMFREALRMTLETIPGMQVVAEVDNGKSILAQVDSTRPDVVCMDINMPMLSGIEATQLLRIAHPEVRVVGLSAHADPTLVAQMIAAGALGYVVKSNAGHELPKAIDHVMRQQIFLSSEFHDDGAE